MAKQKKRKIDKTADKERLVDLLERLGVVGLYLFTDMDHHAIARRLEIGTQRVTAILKGLEKPPKQHARKTK